MSAFYKMFLVVALTSGVCANLRGEDEGENGEKVQKITFIEDDAQMLITSKVYALKHVKSADIAPFVRSAVVRFVPASTVSPLSIPGDATEYIIVSTPQDMMPFVDEMVEKLDYKCDCVSDRTHIAGTGVCYGRYTPLHRPANALRRIINQSGISSGANESFVGFDTHTSTFYFKDCATRVNEIIEKMQWLDQEIPQARVTVQIYEISEREVKDIGVDYLAWKNGPGLNLFEAGYEAMGAKAAERAFQQATQTAIDLTGNFSYAFGGMYTAPAFDLSFIRILQQNGVAKINSSATLLVHNARNRTFSVMFDPEYQNITKNEDFQTGVDVGGNSSLGLKISNVVLTRNTTDTSGLISCACVLEGSNVVGRNNYGNEILESTNLSTTLTTAMEHEKLVSVWEKKAKVKQTIGIPWLCEIPYVGYIFGTETESEDRIFYFMTFHAEWPAPMIEE